MTSLYELSGVQRAINTKLEIQGGELDDEALEELMDKNYPQLVEKLQAYGWMIEVGMAEIAELDGWTERVLRRRNASAETVKRLRVRMAEGMLRADIKKVEGRKSPDMARVLELALEASGLHKAIDRAERNNVLDKLLEELQTAKPPISWTARESRGTIEVDDNINLDLLRAFAEINDFEGLIVEGVTKETTSEARIDKKVAKVLIDAENELPGISLKKEARLYAGE